MSSSFVFQHLRLWVKTVSRLDDVISGLTGNPLRSKIYTYTHPVDYLENWRENVNLNIYLVLWKKWRENLGSPLSSSLCKVFEELMRSH